VPHDRTNSLILGLAFVGGGLVALLVVAVLAVMVDAGTDGRYLRNPSGSMMPTILNGDYITARGIDVPRDPSAIHRGDIVIHEFPPDRAKQFVKRVLGVPGDTLAMKNAVLIINGKPLREAYTQHVREVDPVTSDFDWQRRYLVTDARLDTAHYVASRDTWGPLLVPAGQYFVLGDNRTESLDSRWFGFVPAHEVLARVRRVYFSRDDSTGEIRWSRIGHAAR